MKNNIYVSWWSRCTLGKCSEAQLEAAPSFSFEVETKTNKEKRANILVSHFLTDLAYWGDIWSRTPRLLVSPPTSAASSWDKIQHKRSVKRNKTTNHHETSQSQGWKNSGTCDLSWSTYRWPSSVSLRSRRCLSWVRENHSISICSSSSSKIRHKHQCYSELTHTAITESGLFYVQPQFQKALEQNAMNCKPFLIKM